MATVFSLAPTGVSSAWVPLSSAGGWDALTASAFSPAPTGGGSALVFGWEMRGVGGHQTRARRLAFGWKVRGGGRGRVCGDVAGC